MCRKKEDYESTLFQNIDLMSEDIKNKTKGKNKAKYINEIYKAGCFFAEKDMAQQSERLSDIDKSTNFLLVVIGFIVTGACALLSRSEFSDKSKYLLISSLIISLVSIIIILFALSYYKNRCLPSPMNTVKQLLEKYRCDLCELDKDRDALKEGYYVLTIEKTYNDLDNIIKKKRLFFILASILTIISFVILITSLFF